MDALEWTEEEIITRHRSLPEGTGLDRVVAAPRIRMLRVEEAIARHMADPLPVVLPPRAYVEPPTRKMDRAEIRAAMAHLPDTDEIEIELDDLEIVEADEATMADPTSDVLPVGTYTFADDDVVDAMAVPEPAESFPLHRLSDLQDVTDDAEPLLLELDSSEFVLLDDDLVMVDQFEAGVPADVSLAEHGEVPLVGAGEMPILLSRLAPEISEAEFSAARRRADAQYAAEQHAALQQAAEQRAVEQRAAEQRAVEQRAAEQRAAEQRAAEQRAAEQRAAEQRAAEQRAAEQRAAEQRAAEQRAAEQRAVEQRAAEQRAAEQRAADLQAAEQRAADRRAAAAERRAAEQRAAEQRAGDEQTEPIHLTDTSPQPAQSSRDRDVRRGPSEAQSRPGQSRPRADLPLTWSSAFLPEPVLPPEHERDALPAGPHETNVPIEDDWVRRSTSLAPLTHERTRPPAAPKGRRWAKLAGVALAPMLGVLLVFAVVKLAPSVLAQAGQIFQGHGRLQIDVAEGAVPPSAVYVDGHRRCDTTPCVVDDLAPGNRDIKAVFADARVVSETHVVRADADTIVVLKPPATTTTPSPRRVAVPVGRIVMASKQRGVEVALKGQPQQALPVTLSDLKPGKYTLVFTAPHRKKLERRIVVGAHETVRLDEVSLPLKTGQLHIASATVGARLLLAPKNGIRRALKGPFPKTFEIEPGHYDVIAVRPGFRAKVVAITLADDTPEATLDMELVPGIGGYRASY